MQKDLATSIVLAIVGVLIAFFVTNLFFGEIENFSLKTISTTVDSELEEPNPEIFNYKSLNPTVEVYVGECTEFNSYGECIDGNSQSSNNNGETNQGSE